MSACPRTALPAGAPPRPRVLALALLLVASPAPALAGMPAVFLSDVARVRLSAVSFFCACFLVSAKGVQALWNALRADFPALPLLSYRRALQLLGLWGAAFVLVLTMISGARELMTPGAWTRQATTYKLTGSSQDRMSSTALVARRARLERLRIELWRYAAQHAGAFPPHDLVDDIPAADWDAGDPSGARFIYAPGATPDHGAVPVVWEPGVFGADRFALLSNGDITNLPLTDIQARLAERTR